MNKSAKPTTVILAGGYMGRAEDGGEAFYQAIVGNRQSAKILICCFAQPVDKWATSFEDYENRIMAHNEGKELTFENARPDQFVDQIDRADVVMFLGGNANDLATTLAAIPCWTSQLRGKTVVGSSAGANVLAARYVIDARTKARLAPGFDLVPGVVVVHYRSSGEPDDDFDWSSEFWDEIDTLMADGAEGKMQIKLREGEFVTFHGINL